MSGGRESATLAKPAATAIIPQRRHLPRHRHSHSPPNVIDSKPFGGIFGTGQTLPGQPATSLATHNTASIPQPIGTSARRSRPNGINRLATSAQGNVHTAVIGTASMLATGEYIAHRWK